MSIALENKTNTIQNLLKTLNPVADKNSVIDFDAIGEALQYLETNGIPNAKHEEYKYCNTDAVFRKEFKTIANKFTEPAIGKGFKECINIFIVNGRFHSVEGSAEGLVISSLEEALKNNKAIIEQHLAKHIQYTNDAFAALNTVYCQNGVFIHLKKNASINKPIFIHYITECSETSMIFPRLLMVCEAGSKAVLTEINEASGGVNYFSASGSEIVVSENAHIKHIRLQTENENAYSVSTIEVVQSPSSTYDAATYIFGGALIRNNHFVRLMGSNIESHLNGLIIGKNQSLIDNHTYIDHAMPHCESNELYKGIAYDKSTLVFNGKIMVRRDAQKTNAYQSSKNILMSDDATVDTKPQLEIYADDVKCSHGTSTGKVDEDALFYLKARGIGDTSARKLLLQAFAEEVIDKVDSEEMKSIILKKFEAAIN